MHKNNSNIFDNSNVFLCGCVVSNLLFHGKTLTKDVLSLLGFCFLVSSLSRGKSYKLEVSLTVGLSLPLCLTQSLCRCL